MVGRDWAPDEGEVIWINFDPQAGREQGGHRPAVVLSPKAYNQLVGLVICVPMTTRIKGYAFEVAIAGGQGGSALSDHLKSLDWRARRASPKGRVTAEELETIRERARQLFR